MGSPEADPTWGWSLGAAGLAYVVICPSIRPTAADRVSWRRRAWGEVPNEAHDVFVLEASEHVDLGVEALLENLRSMQGTALLVSYEPHLRERAAPTTGYVRV